MQFIVIMAVKGISVKHRPTLYSQYSNFEIPTLRLDLKP